MKKSIFQYSLLLMLLSLVTFSCTSDDRDIPEEETPVSGDYSQGLFILNEGGFGASNASVSFLDDNGEVFNSIFSSVNDRTLGDTAQSMGFNGDNGYVVVNNSATIEVVNRDTFESITTVTDQIVNPRYITFSGNFGFITNWGDPNDTTDDYVAVLNLATNSIESKIMVAEGPETMVMHNGNLYVAHKGGYGYGNTITVIDVASQQVTTSITVADVPTGMVVANDGLYVLCAGKAPFTQDETIAQLFKIDANTNTVENSITFPEGVHPGFLELDNNTLYYTIDGAVYTISLSEFQILNTPVLEPATDGLEILYGFKVADGRIYIADAKDYASNGSVFIYQTNGTLLQQFTVSLIPNSFYINN